MITAHRQLIPLFHPIGWAGYRGVILPLCLLLGAPVASAHPNGFAKEPACPYPPSMVQKKMEPPGILPPPISMHRNPLRSVLHLPGNAQKVQLPELYFSNGLFYLQVNGSFQVVPPPPGTMVRKLPERATTLLMKGQRYYTLEGIFYQHQAGKQAGYRVIAPPPGLRQKGPHPMAPPPPVSQGATPERMAEPNVVSVIRHAGKKEVEVLLKRKGHQWIGPSGEVYDRLPLESELVKMAQ